MPRDYAKRKPAPKKKQGGGQSRRKEPAPKRAGSSVFIVVVIAAIVGFVYLLTTISGQADKETARPVGTLKPTPTPAKTQTKPKPTLPSQPEERWTFIEELENKEVEVDVPDAPESTRPYLMQCGSFRAQSQANALKAKIAFQGLSSEVRRSEGSNGVWYKVVLGPYETKRLAEKDRHLLQRGKVRGCQIWFW